MNKYILLMAIITTFRQHCTGFVFPNSMKGMIGSRCRHSSGIPGVCQLYTECQNLPSGVWRSNTCGYIRKTPVWCCPTVSEKTRKTLITPIAPISECGKRPNILNRNRIKRSDDDVIPSTSAPVPNVVGGEPSAVNGWPWAVLLGDTSDPSKPDWFCGGSIINKDWVLTSAHCVLRKSLTARLGEHDFTDPFDGTIHVDIEVAYTVLYPDYMPSSNNHDLALLKLKKSIDFNDRISPVCLPWNSRVDDWKNLVSNYVTTIGWGAVEFLGTPSSVLMEANLTVFDVERCKRSYSQIPGYKLRFPSSIDADHYICAGHPAGLTDSCTGDSGGPLLLQCGDNSYMQVGVVALGYGCGGVEFPGLYMSLYNQQYLQWIREVAFTNQSDHH